MPSFDVVCETDLQEIDNAVNMVDREISQRFDFRGSKATIAFERDKKIIKITADDDMKLRAIHQLLTAKVAKRDMDPRCMVYGKEVAAGGNTIRQEITIKSGLDKEEAKKVVSAIKGMDLKVQVQIQDEQVRVTGKKIDDLQSVIANLKSADLGLALQYVNMRS